MCRLYGFRANEPTKVECTLVHAQNALLLQSQSDELGRAHPDGWGIGYFEGTAPFLEKNSDAAFRGLHFSNTAERVYSQAVVSHVRLATVGQPSIENCHPFRFGSWIGAHNGTVTAINEIRQGMLDEVSPPLREEILGTTDSELLIFWLLQRFMNAHVANAAGCISRTGLVEEFAAGILEVDERCRATAGAKPAKLNVVLTDGQFMIASRFRNSLSWLQRDGIRDCEICGIPHVEHFPGFQYRAVVIASEPVSHEAWQSVPDGAIVAVDENAKATLVRFANLETKREPAGGRV